MPRWIVKLAADEYIEWSTVVDAPISTIVSRHTAANLWGLDRVKRADAHTTSCIENTFWYTSPEEFVAGNRAGEGESELSLAQIRAIYGSEGTGDTDG